MKKPKNVLIIISILIVTGIIGFFLYNQGYLSLGDPQLCDTEPYSENCYCQSDYEKLSVKAFGIEKYVCESLDKFINPTDSDWEQQAKTYAEQSLLEAYPTCNSIGCADGTETIMLGWKDYEKRLITVECLTSSIPQQILNNIRFHLDTGEIYSNSCGDFIAPTENDPETTISFEGYKYGLLKFRIYTKCKGIGNVDEKYTHKLPYSRKAADWYFRGSQGAEEIMEGRFHTCTLENKLTDGVTIQCTGECNGDGGIGEEFSVRYIAPIDTCYLDNAWYDVDTIKCCSAKQTRVTCRTAGNWGRSATVCDGTYDVVDCSAFGY